MLEWWVEKSNKKESGSLSHYSITPKLQHSTSEAVEMKEE